MKQVFTTWSLLLNLSANYKSMDISANLSIWPHAPHHPVFFQQPGLYHSHSRAELPGLHHVSFLLTRKPDWPNVIKHSHEYTTEKAVRL